MSIDQSTIMVLLFVASHAVHPRWPRHGGGGRVMAAVAGSGSLDNIQHQQEDPSTGADAVRKDREPRPARRQLSRFLLCVTGSWKRSCGSSCSLAAGRLRRPGGAKNPNTDDGKRPEHGKSTCSFKKDYCLIPNNNNNKSVLHSGRSVIVCVVMGTAAYSFDM